MTIWQRWIITKRERCGRAGSYRLGGPAERFGADAGLPDVLMAISAGERRASFSQPGGAKFADLAAARS
jgi:hypothetical protein